MEYGFSFLMFALSGGLLLYAGLLAATKDPKLIVRNQGVEMKDPKKYAVQFAKVLAIVAIAPALGGILGLVTSGPRVGIALVGATIGCIGFAVAKIDLDV